ncbi:hypothetical protein SNEBB_009771 [Seison nebaliae]|nr:hypothetical protein SNEBB_009771 [Seison nebaliae]
MFFKVFLVLSLTKVLTSLTNTCIFSKDDGKLEHNLQRSHLPLSSSSRDLEVLRECEPKFTLILRQKSDIDQQNEMENIHQKFFNKNSNDFILDNFDQHHLCDDDKNFLEKLKQKTVTDQSRTVMNQDDEVEKIIDSFQERLYGNKMKGRSSLKEFQKKLNTVIRCSKELSELKIKCYNETSNSLQLMSEVATRIKLKPNDKMEIALYCAYIKNSQSVKAYETNNLCKLVPKEELADAMRQLKFQKYCHVNPSLSVTMEVLCQDVKDLTGEIKRLFHSDEYSKVEINNEHGMLPLIHHFIGKGLENDMNQRSIAVEDRLRYYIDQLVDQRLSNNIIIFGFSNCQDKQDRISILINGKRYLHTKSCPKGICQMERVLQDKNVQSKTCDLMMISRKRKKLNKMEIVNGWNSLMDETEIDGVKKDVLNDKIWRKEIRNVEKCRENHSYFHYVKEMDMLIDGSHGDKKDNDKDNQKLLEIYPNNHILNNQMEGRPCLTTNSHFRHTNPRHNMYSAKDENYYRINDERHEMDLRLIISYKVYLSLKCLYECLLKYYGKQRCDLLSQFLTTSVLLPLYPHQKIPSKLLKDSNDILKFYYPFLFTNHRILQKILKSFNKMKVSVVPLEEEKENDFMKLTMPNERINLKLKRFYEKNEKLNNKRKNLVKRLKVLKKQKWDNYLDFDKTSVFRFVQNRYDRMIETAIGEEYNDLNLIKLQESERVILQTEDEYRDLVNISSAFRSYSNNKTEINPQISIFTKTEWSYPNEMKTIQPLLNDDDDDEEIKYQNIIKYCTYSTTNSSTSDTIQNCTLKRLSAIHADKENKNQQNFLNQIQHTKDGEGIALSGNMSENENKLKLEKSSNKLGNRSSTSKKRELCHQFYKSKIKPNNYMTHYAINQRQTFNVDPSTRHVNHHHHHNHNQLNYDENGMDIHYHREINMINKEYNKCLKDFPLFSFVFPYAHRYLIEQEIPENMTSILGVSLANFRTCFHFIFENNHSFVKELLKNLFTTPFHIIPFICRQIAIHLIKWTDEKAALNDKWLHSSFNVERKAMDLLSKDFNEHNSQEMEMSNIRLLLYTKMETISEDGWWNEWKKLRDLSISSNYLWKDCTSFLFKNSLVYPLIRKDIHLENYERRMEKPKSQMLPARQFSDSFDSSLYLDMLTIVMYQIEEYLDEDSTHVNDNCKKLLYMLLPLLIFHNRLPTIIETIEEDINNESGNSESLLLFEQLQKLSIESFGMDYKELFNYLPNSNDDYVTWSVMTQDCFILIYLLQVVISRLQYFMELSAILFHYFSLDVKEFLERRNNLLEYDELLKEKNEDNFPENDPEDTLSLDETDHDIDHSKSSAHEIHYFDQNQSLSELYDDGEEEDNEIGTEIEMDNVTDYTDEKSDDEDDDDDEEDEETEIDLIMDSLSNDDIDNDSNVEISSIETLTDENSNENLNFFQNLQESSEGVSDEISDNYLEVTSDENSETMSDETLREYSNDSDSIELSSDDLTGDSSDDSKIRNSVEESLGSSMDEIFDEETEDESESSQETISENDSDDNEQEDEEDDDDDEIIDDDDEGEIVYTEKDDNCKGFNLSHSQNNTNENDEKSHRRFVLTNRFFYFYYPRYLWNESFEKIVDENESYLYLSKIYRLTERNLPIFQLHPSQYFRFVLDLIILNIGKEIDTAKYEANLRSLFGIHWCCAGNIPELIKNISSLVMSIGKDDDLMKNLEDQFRFVIKQKNIERFYRLDSRLESKHGQITRTKKNLSLTNDKKNILSCFIRNEKMMKDEENDEYILLKSSRKTKRFLLCERKD